MQLLFRFVGVADIASVRFSLPAQLLEPRPNLGMFYCFWWGTSFSVCDVGRRDEANVVLEYWNYLDRPETFARSVKKAPFWWLLIR